MTLCVPHIHHHCSSSPTELARFTKFPENGLIYKAVVMHFGMGIMGSAVCFLGTRGLGTWEDVYDWVCYLEFGKVGYI